MDGLPSTPAQSRKEFATLATGYFRTRKVKPRRMTREQLLNLQKNSPQPLRMRASSLPNFDFSGMDLTGADLSFSNLERANFDGAILRNATIRAAALTRASFRNADLTNADLSFSSLMDADLTGAKIDGINFSFSAREKSFDWENFSLIGLIQSQEWVGTLVAIILGAIMLYGFNAIVFFTAEIYFTSEPVRAGLYQFLTIQNITAGVLTVVLTQAMGLWLDQFIRREVLQYLVLSVIIVGFNLILDTGVYFLFGADVVSKFTEYYPNEAGQKVPWYWYMIGSVMVANAIYYLGKRGKQLSRKMSNQEVQLLNLEKLKTRAELDALQARINPHFLYNSLNSIASLVHEDPDKAEEMTLLLSKLFRYTTGRKNEDYFDSIEHELEMVATYLKVEQVRFGTRLKFTVEVQDPALNELRIPKFLLQPVVENAVKHGISKLPEQGCIRVKIYEQEGCLHLCVYDNGPAFPDTMNAGYGLRSIQDKLRLLYQEDALVELHNAPQKYLCVKIKKQRLTEPPGSGT